MADPIVGAIVGIMVARAGVNIIRESAEVLVDKIQADASSIREIVCGIKGVSGCHDIRTRGTKNYVFIDLHVLVNPALTVEEGHRIADSIENEIKKRMPEVVDVAVHVEPLP